MNIGQSDRTSCLSNPRCLQWWRGPSRIQPWLRRCTCSRAPRGGLQRHLWRDLMPEGKMHTGGNASVSQTTPTPHVHPRKNRPSVWVTRQRRSLSRRAYECYFLSITCLTEFWCTDFGLPARQSYRGNFLSALARVTYPVYANVTYHTGSIP